MFKNIKKNPNFPINKLDDKNGSLRIDNRLELWGGEEKNRESIIHPLPPLPSHMSLPFII